MPIAIRQDPLALILSRSTSMTIYTPITPTYLYVKQLSVTGLKYFGKTTNDPYTYKGSGKHWTRHIKKHGKKHIVTLWVSNLFYDTSIVDYALQFSKENNIVESKEWANMEPENGLNGWVPGKPFSDDHKAKISAGNKGRIVSVETKTKISIGNKGKTVSDETKAKLRKPKTVEHKAKISAGNKGKKLKPLSDETKAKMSASKKGKILSDETKAKMCASSKGKPKSDEARANMAKPKSDEHKAKISAAHIGKTRPYCKSKLVECPHCKLIGGVINMTRYHFDNCKFKL